MLGEDFVVVVTEPIRAPFMNVAVHVVQTKWVWALAKLTGLGEAGLRPTYCSRSTKVLTDDLLFAKYKSIVVPPLHAIFHSVRSQS